MDAGNRPRCQMLDASAFIGMCTLPVGSSQSFLKGLEGFFENYAERHLEPLGIKCWGKKPESKTTLLNKPFVYYILGGFDAAVIALEADYDIGIRFHASNPLWGDTQTDESHHAALKFSHKAILGPIPAFSSDTKAEDLFERAFKKHRENGSEVLPLPLIGICQLKLDSGLLLGAGTDLVRCVLWAVKRFYDIHQKKGKTLRLIALESYSWHELTLLLFSDSFSTIIDFVTDVRELSLKEVRDLITASIPDGNGNKTDHQNDWQYLKSQKSLRLLLWQQVNPDAQPDSDSLLDAHVFWTSTTSLGFRIELMQEGKDAEFQQISEEKDLLVSARWTAKAGHIKVLSQKVDEIGGRECGYVMICSGRGDFVWPADTYRGKRMSSREFVEYKRKAHGDAPDNERQVHPVHDAFDTSTSLAVARKRDSLLGISATERPGHFVMLHHLWPKLIEKGLVFRTKPHTSSACKGGAGNCVAQAGKCKQPCVHGIRNCLAAAGVPHIIARRALSCLALYNQGMLDPFLFPLFLGLEPLVNAIRVQAVGLAEHAAGQRRSMFDQTDRLNDYTKLFDRAWHNRFHASWFSGDITDFNLDFKGGIHQLVLAFDAAYKTMCSGLLASRRPAPAVIVGGTRIQSRDLSIELSYHDILSPEFFAARAAHEAAETELDYVVKENKDQRPFHVPDNLEEYYYVRAPRPRSPSPGAVNQRNRKSWPRRLWRWLRDRFGRQPQPRPAPGVAGEEELDVLSSDRPKQKLSSGVLAKAFAHEFLGHVTKSDSAADGGRQEELVCQVNQMMRDLWADVQTLKYTFLGDVRLFTYWYSGMLLAEPQCWLPGGQQARPHAMHHALFLLRVASVIAYVTSPDQRPTPVRNGTPDASKLLVMLHPDVPTEIRKDVIWVCAFVNVLLRTTGASRDNDGVINNLALESKLRFKEWVEKAFAHNAGTEGDLPRAIARSSDYMKLLAEGKPPVLDEGVTPQVHLRALNYAYLKLLMCGPDGTLHGDRDETRGYWFHRDVPPGVRLSYESDGTMKTIGEAQNAGVANLLFDPRGGTAARGTAFHRHYFRWRAAYVAALWDHSLREAYQKLAATLRPRPDGK